MNPQVLHAVPRSLISNEGYEVGFTKHDRPYFNARPIDPSAFDPSQDPTNPADNFDWACKGGQVPIVGVVGAIANPLLLADPLRNLLVIQNNSAANGAGDIPPILSIGLDGPVTATPNGGAPGVPFNNFTLNLVPGEGVVLDTRVPTNAIYAAWGPFTNTSGVMIIGGSLMYGRTLNALPAAQ